MRWLLALKPKIFRCAHQAFTKEPQPKLIDQNTRRQWVFLRGQPLGQSEPVSRRILGQLSHDGEHFGCKRFAGGLIVFSTMEQTRLTRLVQIRGHEGRGEVGFPHRHVVSQGASLFVVWILYKGSLAVCQAFELFLRGKLMPSRVLTFPSGVDSNLALGQHFGTRHLDEELMVSLLQSQGEGKMT